MLGKFGRNMCDATRVTITSVFKKQAYILGFKVSSGNASNQSEKKIVLSIVTTKINKFSMAQNTLIYRT